MPTPEYEKYQEARSKTRNELTQFVLLAIKDPNNVHDIFEKSLPTVDAITDLVIAKIAYTAAGGH